MYFLEVTVHVYCYVQVNTTAWFSWLIKRIWLQGFGYCSTTYICLLSMEGSYSMYIVYVLQPCLAIIRSFSYIKLISKIKQIWCFYVVWPLKVQQCGPTIKAGHKNNQTRYASCISLGTIKTRKSITDFNISTRPAPKITCQGQ